VIVIETVTPQAPLRQLVRHGCWAPPHVPRLAAKIVLAGLAAQFERDVPVWSNKIYRAQPVLTKADRTIPPFRRWFSQFTHEGSLSMRDALRMESEGGLDW
jgi:hypothetical protein